MRGNREPVRRAGKVFFPLDQELGLTSSRLTPHAQEGLVRLATWVPFAKAAQLLEGLLGVQVSVSQTRRVTLQAGRGLCENWEEQASEQVSHQPPAPVGAQRTVLRADGAMVPLRGGIWAEVKTLAMARWGSQRRGKRCMCTISCTARDSPMCQDLNGPAWWNGTDEEGNTRTLWQR